jgi:hypothetical protein
LAYRNPIMLLDLGWSREYSRCGSLTLGSPPSVDADTPHPNPLPYTTTACRRTPLPPRGEAREYDVQRPRFAKATTDTSALVNPPSSLRRPPSRCRYGGRDGGQNGGGIRRGIATECRSCGGLGEPNIRFSQTNPPFLGGILDIIAYEQMSCAEKCRRKSVGSFWKTNPPERGFRVV